MYDDARHTCAVSPCTFLLHVELVALFPFHSKAIVGACRHGRHSLLLLIVMETAVGANPTTPLNTTCRQLICV
jgi:hypothetical protein